MTNNDTHIEIQDIQLNLSEYDNGVMSDFQKEFLREELAQLSPIKSGQISIDGIYAFDIGDKVEVSVYIRNGLNENINLNMVPLVIVNKQKEVLAKQIFDMNSLGLVPPLSAKPYKIYFDRENIVVDTIPKDNWEIQFQQDIDLFKTVKVELEEISEDLPYELKKQFQSFLNNLPLTKQGDININVFKVLKNMDNSISIIFMIRNGCNSKITIQQLPITIKNEDEKIIVQGKYDIDNVCVNAYKARMYDFTINAQNIEDYNFDINGCKVYFGD